MGCLGLPLCVLLGAPVASVYAQEKDEFTRVRRIYIEGARFMQEKRYSDAIPMLAQAYKLLNRAVERGSTNKRTLRATKKLRYFLGFCHYQVGKRTASSTKKEDKATTRGHYKKLVPLLTQYIKEGKSIKRRQRSLSILGEVTQWLRKNPPPPRPKPRVIVINKTKPKAPPPSPVPFVIMGAGVLIAAGGLVTALLAMDNLSQRDKLYQTLLQSSEPTGKEVANLHRSAETLATTSYVLWAVGGAVAVVGAILIPVMQPKPKAPTPPKQSASPGQSSLPHITLWTGAEE